MKTPQHNLPKKTSININIIDIQKHISNRINKDIISTPDFLELMASIRATDGVIHPIVVRDTGTGRYELFVGFKRYLAYKNIKLSGYKGFEFIPALIYPKETTTQDMILKTLHENIFRKNPAKVELLHSQISMLPFILNCAKENQKADNFLLGYKILSLYISHLRSKTHIDKYAQKLSNLTGNNNSIDQLEIFFEKLVTSPKSFFLSSKVLFECDKKIRILFTKGKITNRHALAIQSMRSIEDRNMILRMLQEEDISYKKLEEIIRESNAQGSPIKTINKLLKLVEHVSVQINSREETLTEKEISVIKMYIEKIEHIVQK